MSSILLEGSDTPLFEVDNAGEGLRIVGQANESNTFFFGESGEFDGAATEDVITGGLLSDIVFAGEGDDVVFGRAGNDFIDGGEGNDVLQGQEGDDVLVGGSGEDTLIGGSGADTFEFFSGDFAEGELDVIRDFGDGEDSIFIRGIGADANVSYNSETGIVSVDDNDIIKLDNNPADITIDNSNGDDWELF